ncbi:GlxA family transcriptional regulator [Paracoccus sediminis]|uniref:GlxA family transcriptional regulator n=1 Tax=Paracoccus sediminis TaxID=1214787 RepID=A0A238WLQ9_9RHOB|nr:GlxA family transcriptional regulator [Paracoccus sediminis]TBN50512.1 GlxA family transcriptional regulator [Paracoccus sediminis]SNR47164.1 transcriptional regulator, AraC family with amidase-like domain [Paracoccus sediminis]
MASPTPRCFTFLLLDRFTMLPFAATLDALRLANKLSGKPLYEWRLVGTAGPFATCSNGSRMAVDAGVDDDIAATRDEVVVVCGGDAITTQGTRPVLAWLRRQARSGATMAAVCTGAHLLAKAGLLDGRRATIHWENHDSFAETFPDVALHRQVFVDDGARLTAGGGTSSIDMMLHLIGQTHERDLVSQIADQMLHTAIRTGRDHQRLSVATRIGIRHPRLAAIVTRIEANLENPISPPELAADAGISTRQLERLFMRYLDRSPKRYYLEARLGRARHLLLLTDLPLIEIAVACGFSSSSHFSKCYRERYGSSPHRERGVQKAAVVAMPARPDPVLALAS